MQMETNTTAIHPLNVISNRNFETAILSTDRPVLLMCVSGGRVYAQQARVLEQLSESVAQGFLSPSVARA